MSMWGKQDDAEAKLSFRNSFWRRPFQYWRATA
jgi:hypothetical protein